MSRRGRAGSFALLAAICGLASAGLAARAGDGAGPDYGESQTVIVTVERLARGQRLGAGVLGRSLELRDVPGMFLPPDAVHDPGQITGARLSADVPVGSYLLASHLRPPSTPSTSRTPAHLSPIEVRVVAAGAISRSGNARRVDVVATGEPGAGRRAGVEVVAERVRLLGLRPERGGVPGDGAGWLATLALGRIEALEVIAAESFAGEVRLIQR